MHLYIHNEGLIWLKTYSHGLQSIQINSPYTMMYGLYMRSRTQSDSILAFYKDQTHHGNPKEA